MGKKTAGKQRGGNNNQNLVGNTFRDKPERINKKGRPKKVYKEFLAKLHDHYGLERVSQAEYIEGHEMILAGDEQTLKLIHKDSGVPLDFRMMIDMIKDKKYYLQIKSLILDRVFGRSKQLIEASIREAMTPAGAEANVDRQKLLNEVIATLKGIDDEAKKDKTE